MGGGDGEETSVRSDDCVERFSRGAVVDDLENIPKVDSVLPINTSTASDLNANVASVDTTLYGHDPYSIHYGNPNLNPLPPPQHHQSTFAYPLPPPQHHQSTFAYPLPPPQHHLSTFAYPLPPPQHQSCYPHQLQGYPHQPPPPRHYTEGFPAHIPSTLLAEADAINLNFTTVNAPYKKNFTLVHRETLAKALDELGNNPGAILSDERYKDAFYGVSEEILKHKIQKFEDYYDYICKDPSWKKRPGSYLEGPSATRPRLIREASSSQPARAQGALQEQIQQMCNTAVDAAFENILPILSLAQAQGASSSQPAQGAQREQIQQAFDTALERILPILKDLLDRRPPNDNDNLQ